MGLAIPLLWLKREKTAAIRTFFSAGIAWFSAQVIKSLFYVPRPYLVDHVQALVLKAPTDSSFPSGHTTTAFAIATSLYLYNRKWGLVGYALAILVGLLRIWGRVHTPVDVLAGVVLGTSVTLIIRVLYGKLVLWRKVKSG